MYLEELNSFNLFENKILIYNSMYLLRIYILSDKDYKQ